MFAALVNVHLGLLLQVDPLDLEEVEQGGVLEADVLTGHVTPAGPILKITNVFTTEAMEEIFWWLSCVCVTNNIASRWQQSIV